MTRRRSQAERLLLVAWLLPLAATLAWAIAGLGPAGRVAAGVGVLLPLLSPLPGLLAGRERTLRWAPLTLAPALLWAATEALVSPASRGFAAATLAGVLLAFAANIAALRAPR